MFNYSLIIKTATTSWVEHIQKKLNISFFLYLKKKKLITVIKSPFVHKKGRNQFYLMQYRYSAVLNVDKIISPFFLEALLLLLFKSVKVLTFFFKKKKTLSIY